VETQIHNLTTWTDTAGNPIVAHDGSISQFGDTYYWYGADYTGNPAGDTYTRSKQLPFRVYSSTDLVHWTYNGPALDFNSPTNSAPGNDIRTSAQRPAVVYNDATGKYDMWLYEFANHISPDIRLRVAEASSPVGPFTLIPGLRQSNSPELSAGSGLPGCAGDMGMYKDETTGNAYLVYDDMGNKGQTRNLRVDQLTADYHDVLHGPSYTTVAMAPPAGFRGYEGAAIVKYHGKWIVGGSEVNGWNNTPSHYSTSNSPLGTYTVVQNLIDPTQPTANDPGHTFEGQISSFFYIKQSDTLMAMIDQWDWSSGTFNAETSKYLWVPVNLNPNGTVTLSDLTNWTPLPAPEPSTLVLLGIGLIVVSGLLGLGMVSRLRRKRTEAM
jgi:hypothetical protein